ncbi:hypothetical protein DP125_06005 [Clostridium tetani]|uniref:hypothetical protein n=1 Tax=Clostridium tetani TaxID=1513 RepID=UPI0010098F77|nr:hypothetical protein [Clostridium tetani]RXI60142.1 hypothetical protein DP132_11660 [Clostridium tetani]RXI61025.1 hypothetical protein DP125_06005 [Clostridium tetani]RXI64973.1 hypothetical protein DP123_06480 [Clostridium tetani]RXI71018.1 hypothetical protein DP121_05755 [Clostridium tetani]
MKTFKVYEALKLLAENPNLEFKVKLGNVIVKLEPTAMGHGYDPNNELSTIGFYNIHLNSIALLGDDEIK